MKEHKKSQTKEKNLLCRLAEIVAPQASEFCWGLYYQPKEPDKMREFVAASKRNDIYSVNLDSHRQSLGLAEE